MFGLNLYKFCSKDCKESAVVNIAFVTSENQTKSNQIQDRSPSALINHCISY